MLKLSSSLIHQQNKINWSKFGDQCPRMFFAKVKQRKQATCVYSILNKDKVRVYGFEVVAGVMTNYNQQLLGKQVYPIVDQKIEMCKPVTDEEVKEVMLSIPNNKSHGPGSFKSGFYKVAWLNIGPYVCNVIQEFF